jgi:putative FmdB family regulatory protein
MMYEYQCRDCGSKFEINIPLFCNMVTKITCPDCKSENIRKLFNSIGVIFKGNGFYQNDTNPGKSIE